MAIDIVQWMMIIFHFLWQFLKLFALLRCNNYTATWIMRRNFRPHLIKFQSFWGGFGRAIFASRRRNDAGIKTDETWRKAPSKTEPMQLFFELFWNQLVIKTVNVKC